MARFFTLKTWPKYKFKTIVTYTKTSTTKSVRFAGLLTTVVNQPIADQVFHKKPQRQCERDWDGEWEIKREGTRELFQVVNNLLGWPTPYLLWPQQNVHFLFNFK